MGTYSNYELNSYLTTLTEKWDEEAARAVIATFHQLPVSSASWRGSVESKSDTPFVGHTNEAGDVKIDDKAEVVEKIVGENEDAIARIGHYKVKRMDRMGKEYSLTWQHFWKVDPETMSADFRPKPMFDLGYNSSSLEPVSLKRYEFYLDETAKPPFWRNLQNILYSFYARLTGGEFIYGYYRYYTEEIVLYKKNDQTAP